MKNNYSISVIMPTIRFELVENLKKILEEQSYKPEEIIFVEDKEKRGCSWARNKGISQAKGDLVAFVDDDVVPEKEWLEKLTKAMDRHQAFCAGGTYTESDSLLKDVRERKKFPAAEEVVNDNFMGTGGNLLFKRTCLEDLKKEDGYIFNESFRYGGEDHELFWRLKNKNFKIVFVPSNSLHLKKVNWKNYLKMQFGRGIGIYHLNYFFKKNKIFSSGQSILWDKKNNFFIKFFRVVLFKCLGPFDVKSFSNFRNFFLFWLGEKVQGIGFLYGSVFVKNKLK